MGKANYSGVFLHAANTALGYLKAFRERTCHMIYIYIQLPLKLLGNLLNWHSKMIFQIKFVACKTTN